MNIKKALKLKNKLVLQVSENYQKVSAYNSVEEGSKKPYDTRESLEAYNSSVNELIELKTKIHRANGPVYDKIFRLSELKSMAARMMLITLNSIASSILLASANADGESTANPLGR